MMDDTPTYPLPIYFVNQKTTSTCASLLEAFSHAVQTGSNLLKPHWIHEDDLQDNIATDTGRNTSRLFICEKFSGPAFTGLRQLNLRIWGADCLLSEPDTVVERWLNARVPTIPLLNTFMGGMVVCCSGIPSSSKIRIYERVLLMGGNYSTVLRSSVTHLVTDRVATPKYFAAVKHGMKVMSTDWIEELWEQSLLGHTAERDQIIDLLTSQHQLPPLRGLKIYVDPSLTAKSVFNRLIKNWGGENCLDDSAADITHFVTEKSSASPTAPAKAIRVSPQWLIDSAKNKRCEDWKTYEIPTSSSPMKQSSSRARFIRAKRASIASFSGMSQCATSTPMKFGSIAQNDVLDTISPIKELRRSPRKSKQLQTPEKLATVPPAMTAGFVFSPKPTGRNKRSASPTSSRSKRVTTTVSSIPVDHDENARDGLMDLSPTRSFPTTSEFSNTAISESHKPTSSSSYKRMVSTDSTCDVLLGGSQPNSEPSSSQSQPSSQPATVVPASPIKSSKNLARRVLHLGSVTKSAARSSNPAKSPSKLSTEDFLRPNKASFGGAYHRFSMDASGSSQLSWDHGITSDKKEVSSSSTIPDSRVVPKTRVFMISRMADDFDKDTLIRIQSAVTTLGADYLSSARFDPACTHVICLKPYHTEKFLACCASGRKVLHVNYVFDSLEAGRFLEEDGYEWGNKAAGAFLKDLTDSQLIWATTARWWRSHVTAPESKAFHGWKVIVAPNVTKKESYGAVLQAGGGIVLDNKPDIAQQATHLFHAYAPEEYDQLQILRDTLQLKSDLVLITGHELELWLQEKVHGELPNKRRGSLGCSSTQVPRGSQTAEKTRKPAFSALTLTTIKPLKRKY